MAICVRQRQRQHSNVRFQTRTHISNAGKVLCPSPRTYSSREARDLQPFSVHCGLADLSQILPPLMVQINPYAEA
jgi:hypothetical protein